MERFRPPSDGPCIHLYTSGTTGKPKGCLLSQRGWLAANANLALSFGISADEVVLGVYPFFHVAGLGIVLTTSRLERAVIPASADAEELWRLVDDEAMTTILCPD